MSGIPWRISLGHWSCLQNSSSFVLLGCPKFSWWIFNNHWRLSGSSFRKLGPCFSAIRSTCSRKSLWCEWISFWCCSFRVFPFPDTHSLGSGNITSWCIMANWCLSLDGIRDAGRRRCMLSGLQTGKDDHTYSRSNTLSPKGSMWQLLPILPLLVYVDIFMTTTDGNHFPDGGYSWTHGSTGAYISVNSPTQNKVMNIMVWTQMLDHVSSVALVPPPECQPVVLCGRRSAWLSAKWTPHKTRCDFDGT